MDDVVVVAVVADVSLISTTKAATLYVARAPWSARLHDAGEDGSPQLPPLRHAPISPTAPRLEGGASRHVPPWTTGYCPSNPGAFAGPIFLHTSSHIIILAAFVSVAISFLECGNRAKRGV